MLFFGTTLVGLTRKGLLVRLHVKIEKEKIATIASATPNGSINGTQFESTSSIIIIPGILFFSNTKEARHKLIIIFKFFFVSQVTILLIWHYRHDTR